MFLFDLLGASINAAGANLLAPTSPTGLASYIGGLATVGLIAYARLGRAPRWRAFWKSTFPQRIVRHVSTRADIQMYFLNALMLSSTYGLAIVGAGFWADGAKRALVASLGAHEAWAAPLWLTLGATTIVELVMLELGYYAGHYLMHKIPMLWEFHKVHHSAEVMTPMTEWRQHPVEMVLIPNTISLCNGAAYGALGYVFGPSQPLSLWHMNIVLAIFFLTIGHLRHSHVWLPFTGWLGHLLQSPAHHQIHHSTDPDHFDKNLGFCLAVWDWLFGTLWVPSDADKARVAFGIGAESQDFHDIAGSFVGPFVKIVRPGADGALEAPAPR